MVETQKYMLQHPKTRKTTFLNVLFWQNCLSVATEYVIGKIVTEIQENGGKFSLEIDSSPDISRKEQVSVVVRYVIMSEDKGFTIVERTVVFKIC